MNTGGYIVEAVRTLEGNQKLIARYKAEWEALSLEAKLLMGRIAGAPHDRLPSNNVDFTLPGISDLITKCIIERRLVHGQPHYNFTPHGKLVWMWRPIP